MDNDVKLDELNTPFKPFLRNKNLQLSTTIYKNYFQEVKEIRINTDKNLFFESYEQEKSFKFSSLRESVDLRKENSLFPGTFSQMTFVVSGDTEIYYRKYRKMFEVIIQIGGFSNGILYAAYIILFIYSNNMILYNCISSIISKDEVKARLNKDFKIENKNNSNIKSEMIIINKKKSNNISNINENDNPNNDNPNNDNENNEDNEDNENNENENNENENNQNENNQNENNNSIQQERKLNQNNSNDIININRNIIAKSKLSKTKFKKNR